MKPQQIYYTEPLPNRQDCSRFIYWFYQKRGVIKKKFTGQNKSVAATFEKKTVLKFKGEEASLDFSLLN